MYMEGVWWGGGQRGILLRQRHVAISRLRYLVTRWRCGDEVMCAVVRCEVMRGVMVRWRYGD